MTDADGATSAGREELEYAKALGDSAAQRLNREVESRNRLEGRSGTIVTTTGGLVTAIGAIIAFSPRVTDFRLPPAALIAIVISLMFFLVSIVAAQISNLPWNIKLPERERTSLKEIEALVLWISNTQATDNGLSPAAVAKHALDDFKDAFQIRENNRVVARCFRVAVIAQMFAVTGLTLAALVMLLVATKGRG